MPLDSLKFLEENITEEAVPDEKGNYTIPGVGTFNFTFFDASFLKQGVETFRPLLRGFIVLLLLLYVYREIMAFIGIDPNIDGNGSGGVELSVVDRQTGKAPKMPKGGKKS